MGAVLQFRPRRRPNPHGYVWIWPVDVDGGEWGAFHQLAPKVAPTFLGSRFNFADAERFARIEAGRLRALFDDSVGGTA